jgi:hypothetical protein
MSRKKLIGIIIPCVIAIIVVIVITTHSPATPPEYINVSAYNFTTALFDPELTSLQRQDIWEDYEGKQVKWTSELEEVASGEEESVAYFLDPADWERTIIKAVFDESQRSSLLELKEGDLVIYTGVLTSFGKISGEAEICLRDCVVVSLALESLWWNSELEDAYSVFGVPDADYVYAMVFPDYYRVHKGVYARVASSSPCSEIALNRVSGRIAHSHDTGYLQWYFKDLSELTYTYEGVIYKSVCAVYGGVGTNCGTLQAIDQETGSVLWMMTFQETGMNDFLIADGILYVSTDNGVGAFELPNPTDLQNPNSSETGI